MYLVNLRVLGLILVVHELLVASKLVEIVPIHLSEGEVVDFVRLYHAVGGVEVELHLDVFGRRQMTQDRVVFLQPAPEALDVDGGDKGELPVYILIGRVIRPVVEEAELAQLTSQSVPVDVGAVLICHKDCPLTAMRLDFVMKVLGRAILDPVEAKKFCLPALKTKSPLNKNWLEFGSLL